MLLSLAGCSGFDPRAEFWPVIDASPGAAGAGLVTAGVGSTSGEGGSAAGAVGTTSSAEVTTTGGGAFGTGGAGGTDTEPDDAGEVGGAGGTGGSTGGGGKSGSGGAAGATGGKAGADGDGGTPIRDGGTGTCTLAISVNTVTANGNYSPRNIGAIWIANSSGRFVKSLGVWARTRIRYLTLWNSQTSSAGLSGNTVDAITSATLSSHQNHKVTWNCTDTTKTPVPDGAYRVYFELTDRSGTGPNGFVNFTKGPAPFTMMPPDLNNFKAISMVYTP